jgi:hypothetical protein
MNPQRECWVPSAKNPYVRGYKPFLLLGFLEDTQHTQHLSVGYPPAWGVIFGDSAFAAVPEHAKPSFNRLSRYDETGLVWLLDGRRVVALSEDRAAIRSPSDNVTVYRKLDKPTLGPVGDSLDDLQ